MRISPWGDTLKWGFLGGLASTWAEDIVLDAQGNFHVTGTLWDDGSRSNNPTQGASAFVAKIGGFLTRIDSDSPAEPTSSRVPPRLAIRAWFAVRDLGKGTGLE